MNFEQQRDILDFTYKLLTDFCGGKSPRGSVAPSWEISKEGTDLLLNKGIEYGWWQTLSSGWDEIVEMYYVTFNDVSWRRFGILIRPFKYGSRVSAN